ncbi:hypothetical protein FisN_6Lh233 [Fistulifera solaris]|uniref:Uncharacterized protein n=1 Tax=Fistulifera solaris TaxID=1519565 RepID=A0A1Z5J5X8_FISSO|nr:hypothetical protein FisN_6Lh233 [Fistulifera solaris]|eukprot:GAX09394.1 hypothetical protein FisN_6Lh233 [Fistulifera solaris]
MPTFQSIRMHPQLRLVSGDHVIIETPQALLSRHPAQLQLLRDDEEDGTGQILALPVIEKLRHEVAQALIEQSFTGQRVREIEQRILQWTDNDNDDTTTTTTTSIRFPGTVSLHQLLQYETTIRPPNPLTTGCPTLDTWLDWGLVVQIAGPSGTGKTQLVLQLLAQNGGHYWSSDPALRSIAKRWQELGSSNEKEVSFAYVQNEYDLLRQLQKIITSDHAPPILVIIDSFSTCLTNVEYSDTYMRQQITGVLRSVAQHYQITIVLVNGTVGAAKHDTSSVVENDKNENDDNDNDNDSIDNDDDDEKDPPNVFRSSASKPALSWWNVDDIRIWMETAADQRTVQIRLDRHLTRRQNERLTVRIDRAGVTEFVTTTRLCDA